MHSMGQGQSFSPRLIQKAWDSRLIDFYLRRIDFCITHSRLESNKEEVGVTSMQSMGQGQSFSPRVPAFQHMQS